MRTLNRNTRVVTYQRVVGTLPIRDSYGNDTLEVRKVYSDPVIARWNISAAVGEEAHRVFGDLTNYSRTATICGVCPVSEGDKVKVGDQTYSVVKIADSKNGFMIALREVVGDE